jgi:hypothetical protein
MMLLKRSRSCVSAKKEKLLRRIRQLMPDLGFILFHLFLFCLYLASGRYFFCICSAVEIKWSWKKKHRKGKICFVCSSLFLPCWKIHLSNLATFIVLMM